ncbi:Carbohydrate sulfotransferase 15 [Holothuria leucospilota]|uniref:Carbohydrate sulfotransferase 15 n=1 Tax=Holothuria leucospilota TaxID=206669 RepID=A0A9Q1BVU4_HOLLE|nr:Carbohydrate sulfotransferase 15 [Holothuria leucospilota]
MLLFGITVLSMYGSFIINIWKDKGHPYLFVRQPQSELPVSNRQCELCPCECKIDRNIFARDNGDLNETRGENPSPHVDNEKENVTLQHEILSNVLAQDKRFLMKLDTTKLTHGLNLNVTPKNALQEKEKLQNASRETRTPQSTNNLRSLPTTLYKLASNIFDTVPKEFLQQFKNPCWYDKRRELLCLPYFYILGFPKCGTTDIWDKIHHHPEVEKTAIKEPHFWRGDSSATTIISNYRFVPYATNVTNEMYTNADIIHEITPNAKIIIAIREPVER